MIQKPRNVLVAAAVAAAAVIFVACIEPPPKIAAIPAAGLALRVHVFGASAEDTRRMFDSVKANNPSFSLVTDGGDGEVLVGLDQDTAACVEPTALCEFRVTYRIKNAKGDVLKAENTKFTANSDRCSMLCDKAITSAVTKIVELAATELKGAASAAAASASAAPEASGAPAASGSAKAPPATAKKGQPAAKPDPLVCSVGSGGRLPSEEAEKRIGQVEALKRLGVLEQDEADCLRKAFLARL